MALVPTGRGFCSSVTGRMRGHHRRCRSGVEVSEALSAPLEISLRLSRSNSESVDEGFRAGSGNEGHRKSEWRKLMSRKEQPPRED
jgi:hypothetical protein